jgi:predicted SprT family Zn-dependent metalloprotease
MIHLTESQFKSIAKAEMVKWGLGDWNFKMDNSCTRLGYCDFNKKIICVSRKHMESDEPAHVIDTIRHEIAHGVHYLRRGDDLKKRDWKNGRWVRRIKPHGREWKAIAREVGCTPKATAKSNARSTSSAAYYMVAVVNDKIEELRPYLRKPSMSLKGRLLRGRKSTLDKLFFVDGGDFDRYKKGLIGADSLTFYQEVGNPNTGVVFKNLK